MTKAEEYASLLEFCQTEKEVELINLLSAGMTRKEASESVGLALKTTENRITRIRKRAALRGWSPMHDMVKITPETHFVKGTSTLYDEVGNQRLQWVKTDKTKEEMVEVMREIVDAMKADIPKTQQPRTPQGWFDKECIGWINLGDAHIGMLARACEVGHDFDLKRAEEEICVAIDYLIDSLPAYERVVLNDLGDSTHAENVAGVTSASGNVLDMAGTYPSMIRVAVRVFRYAVEKCLSKFKYVDLIVNQGNHSRANDFWMVELISSLYEECDRLTVLNNENVFIPYRFGNTLIMTHHSDKCKFDKLASVMATDYSEDFGETHYRYIYVGHVHHKQIAKEYAGVTVESFGNLAPVDKYAHEHGYRAGSVITAIELSRTYGEVGRKTLPVEKVKDIIAKSRGGKSYFETKRKAVYTV